MVYLVPSGRHFGPRGKVHLGNTTASARIRHLHKMILRALLLAILSFVMGVVLGHLNSGGIRGLLFILEELFCEWLEQKGFIRHAEQGWILN